MSSYRNLAVNDFTNDFGKKMEGNVKRPPVDILAAGDASKKPTDFKIKHDKRWHGKHFDECHHQTATTSTLDDMKAQSREMMHTKDGPISPTWSKDSAVIVSNENEKNVEQIDVEGIDEVSNAKQTPTKAGEMVTTKYKFDEKYLEFVQNFTIYCENRRKLFFDGSIFFDEFFPRNMNLTEYVPINVIAPLMQSIQLQVPSSSEYCKFAPCGSTLYDYFMDYQAFTDRESILRNQVIFTLSSLQCPQLACLEIESIPQDDITTNGHSMDRFAMWNETISSFISRHSKTLKCIEIKAIRYKSLGVANSLSLENTPKRLFPKLHQLEVFLWDNQIGAFHNTDAAELQRDTENVWLPKWFPDLIDQYWISLMKSQLHGKLTKLCWISAANLSWNEVFQPILDSNRNSLENLQYIEIDTLQNNGNNPESRDTAMNFSESNSLVTSNVVLSCRAFSYLRKLKHLSLRKTNCFLTHLNMLPKSMEELTIDDINLKSGEISSLKCLPNLKILRLGNNSPNNAETPFENSNSETFGVDKQVLKKLLHLRSLQELCVWRHRLKIDMDILSNRSPCILTSVLERINTFLASVCKNSYKISPSQFHKWNSEQLKQNKSFLEGLQQIGVVDEECIVIHCSGEVL